MKEILTMSQKEVYRLQIISEIERQRLTNLEASEILGISERQLYRIRAKVGKEGTKGVIHKLRGRKSNRGYPEAMKERIIELHKKQYWDYGPTLFSEELVKNYSLDINHETLRRWMRSEGIITSERKKRPHRKRRERRSCFGDMIQFDGSHHDWFEGRGPECCLFVCVDDATGKVYLRFAASENTEDALKIMWEYVELNGIPGNLYTDRHSVYKADHKLTDFARAMKELDTKVIYARSPQAKGRVENRNRTLQDRLLKALRQKGISTIAEANKYLQDEFIEEFNHQFGVNPESVNVHRKVIGYDLENIFCYKTTRQVRNDFTINLAGGYLQLLKGESPLPRPKQEVTLSKWLDGSMHIYFNNQELLYKVLPGKPKKKIKLVPKPRNEHPWKKMNKRLPGNRIFASSG